MNWYKIAQQPAPIAIISYFASIGELGISFNGGKKYVYQDVSPFHYNKIMTLLRVKNYRAVQAILKNLSINRPDTEKEKQQMLQQLYDEGYLH